MLAKTDNETELSQIQSQQFHASLIVTNQSVYLRFLQTFNYDRQKPEGIDSIDQVFILNLFPIWSPFFSYIYVWNSFYLAFFAYQ